MNTKASDWGIYPDSDLQTAENIVKFFKYWQAIKSEHIRHFILHKEYIPQFALTDRLMKEFPRYDEDDLYKLFSDGYDAVYGLEEEEDEVAQDDPAMVALSDDLFDFMKDRIIQSRTEKEILDKLEEEL